MRSKGKLTQWNDDKGFGFITPNSGGKRVFVHISAFRHRQQRPEIGQVITYTLSRDPQGRPCAENATRAGEPRPKPQQRSPGTFSITLALLFLGVVGLAVWQVLLPPLLALVYLGASALTFGVYFLDKSAAQRGAWRTRESTLHLLALAGGWPGALIAQQTLRHKSRKQPFRLLFWCTVLLNCTGLGWMCTPDGAATLQAIAASF